MGAVVPVRVRRCPLVAQKLHLRGGIGGALSSQLANAAGSAAANAEEADDGSSRKDFITKERIALREVKETRVRLRVLNALGELSESEVSLIDESTQLIRIVSTIIRNAAD